LVIVLVLVLAGCTGGERPAPDATATPCAAVPASLEVAGSGGVWALLFRVDGREPRTGAELKIVWRVPGTGDPTFRATGPDGAAVTPAWGPVGHAGSSWQRPGDEFGTGWVFPTAGCWTLSVDRSGGTVGAVTLPIVAGGR